MPESKYQTVGKVLKARKWNDRKLVRVLQLTGVQVRTDEVDRRRRIIDVQALDDALALLAREGRSVS